MLTDELARHGGEWKIIVLDAKTRLVKSCTVVENHIMNESLDQMAEILIGTAPDFEIKYLALGTDSTDVTNADLTLGAEVFRIAPAIGPTRMSVGVIQTEFTVLATEAVSTLEEIGIFCGSTASAAADSGLLMSRILWHHVKTNTEELAFIRTDTIGRG